MSQLKDEFAILKKSRQYLRQRITKVVNAISSELPNISQYDRLQNIDKLQAFKKELDDLNKSIFPLYIKSQIPEESVDSEILTEQDHDDKILQTITALKSNPNLGQQTFQSPISDGTKNNLTLPKVPLPQFSNSETDDLQKFFRSFEFIISKHNLTSYEKFIYLRNQITGSPRALIDSIDVQQQSYEIAKDLLIQAFDSKITSKFNIV